MEFKTSSRAVGSAALYADAASKVGMLI